jgi:hypothetical protein
VRGLRSGIHAGIDLHVRFHPGRGRRIACDSRAVGRLNSYHCGFSTASWHECHWEQLIGETDYYHPVLPAVSAWNYYTYDATGALRSQRPNDDAWLHARRKEVTMPETHPACTQPSSLWRPAPIPYPPGGVNFAYDLQGRLRQVLDKDGQVLVAYDWETKTGRPRKVPRAREGSKKVKAARSGPHAGQEERTS